MWKRFIAAVVLVLVLACAAPVCASSGRDILRGVLGDVINEAVKSSKSEQKTTPEKTTPSANNTDSLPSELPEQQEYNLTSIGLDIRETLVELGNRILAYNKPSLETKLTRQEREYDEYGDGNIEVSDTLYNRVCVKGKTIVLGVAGMDKKFRTFWIATGDEGFPEKADIHVGADIRVVEAELGMSLQRASAIKGWDGIIPMSPNSFEAAYISYNGNNINELSYGALFPGDLSNKAKDFALKKAKELGISTFRF